MFDRTHECFLPPESNLALWRYMDFTKLLSLLEDRQLFLARADQFEDPYEGALSRAGVALLRDPRFNGGIPPHAIEQMISSADIFRQEMFISCWIASEHESAAMWKLYLQSPEGVAIRSNFELLAAALDRSQLSARATLVKYVDYDTTQIPMGNLFFPFVHKRLSFAHENELRVIAWASEDVNKPLINSSATHVSIDIDPNELIQAIHVSPTAPRWFGLLVEKVVRRYGVTCPVVRSGLYDRPTY